jgi:hypothetical protein
MGFATGSLRAEETGPHLKWLTLPVAAVMVRRRAGPDEAHYSGSG